MLSSVLFLALAFGFSLAASQDPCLTPICIVNYPCDYELPLCAQLLNQTIRDAEWLRFDGNRVAGTPTEETFLHLGDILTSDSCEITIAVLNEAQAARLGDCYEKIDDAPEEISHGPLSEETMTQHNSEPSSNHELPPKETPVFHKDVFWGKFFELETPYRVDEFVLEGIPDGAYVTFNGSHVRGWSTLLGQTASFVVKSPSGERLLVVELEVQKRSYMPFGDFHRHLFETNIDALGRNPAERLQAPEVFDFFYKVSELCDEYIGEYERNEIKWHCVEDDEEDFCLTEVYRVDLRELNTKNVKTRFEMLVECPVKWGKCLLIPLLIVAGFVLCRLSLCFWQRRTAAQARFERLA